jgi:signal transduction histidine kinase
MIANDKWSVVLNEGLAPALHVALALERASMGSIFLRDAHGALAAIASVGLTPDQCADFGRGLSTVGLFAADANQRHLFLPDATLAFGRAVRLRHVARRIGFRAADLVPLRTRDTGVIGAMALLFRTSRRPDTRVARLTQELCDLIGLALENAQLRDAAERRREAAEQMARGRLQFMAKVGHELRTPLQSITGYVELLRLGLPDPPTPRQRDLLDRVREAERLLLGVVDDLNELARAESGQWRFELSRERASRLVTAAMTIVSPLARTLGVTMSAAPPNPDPEVQTDHRKALQVLVNLCTNALKVSHDGGMVRLQCRTDGDVVHFDVVDEGPGIPPDRLAAVFEPYVQLGSHAGDGASAGLGLGLSIARELAAGMGGTVTAESAPGRGSAFTLTLPRCAEDSAEARP